MNSRFNWTRSNAGKRTNQKPKRIDYCGKRQIRLNDPTNIFLRKGQRRNGDHVELYTYHLYSGIFLPKHRGGKLSPFTSVSYAPVSTDDFAPSLTLSNKINGEDFRVVIWNNTVSQLSVRLRSNNAQLIESLRKTLKGKNDEDTVLVAIELDLDKAEKLVEKISKILKKQIVPQ